MLPYPPKQKVFARRLRRSQTDAEAKLWMRLRDRQLSGAKFRRQHPIGPYIVDFCCPHRRLVVELDGSHHAAQTSADEARTRFLKAQGYRVVRFWDHEVLNQWDAVLEEIVRATQQPSTLALSQRARVGREG